MNEGIGYVYSKTLSPAELKSFLDERQEKLGCVIQETGSDITFDPISKLNQPRAKGRAFGEELEVRWERREGGDYHVLVLSETEQRDLLGDGWQEREMTTIEGRRVYLWGRHYRFLRGGQRDQEPHVWVQASIPRPLEYPLDDHEFAYIEAVEYRQNGMMCLTRFKGLKGENRQEVEGR
jgi:hypothetical protein